MEPPSRMVGKPAPGHLSVKPQGCAGRQPALVPDCSPQGSGGGWSLPHEVLWRQQEAHVKHIKQSAQQVSAKMVIMTRHFPNSLEYIQEIAGCRTVPVEVGSRYTDEEWSQTLMTVSEFISRYIVNEVGHFDCFP